MARQLYGDDLAAAFGPLKLKAVREAMIRAGWCRSLVNNRVRRLRRIFKWAASEELIPVSVFDSLRTVFGLQRGRTEAREAKPVGPVNESVVDATLPFLNRHVRGLVELQWLTGCSPGEAVAVRRCDIDMGGTVWLYRPIQHKTQHHGKSRVITIGPRAQAVIRGFFITSIDAYLFSPRREREENEWPSLRS